MIVQWFSTKCSLNWVRQRDFLGGKYHLVYNCAYSKEGGVLRQHRSVSVCCFHIYLNLQLLLFF